MRVPLRLARLGLPDHSYDFVEGKQIDHSPRAKRAMNRCHQLLVNACHRQARLEIMHVTKMVPLLPRKRFIGAVNLSHISHSVRGLQGSIILPASKDCAAEIWCRVDETSQTSVGVGAMKVSFPGTFANAESVRVV